MRASGIVWILILSLFLLTALGCAQEDDSNSDDDASLDDDAAGDDDDDTLADPGRLGPYAVGNTTRIFVDESRHDLYPNGPRRLLTEIWYPVLPEDAVGDYDTPADMLQPWTDLIVRVFSLILPEEEVQNLFAPMGTIRDVPIAPDGPYPVVLYSHGNGGVRFQAYTFAEHLASHGFIVVSPDHPGNAFATAFPDRLVIYNPISLPFDLVKRPQDMAFLLTTMEQLNAFDPEGIFTGMIDAEHAAVTGHSLGGVATLETFRRDPRFSAAIPFAGPDLPAVEEEIEQGLMSFVGMEDKTLGEYLPLHTLIYELMPAPKSLIRMFKAGHYTFTNTCDIIPTILGDGDGCGTAQSWWDDSTIEFIEADLAWEIINTYATAWLAWRLRGDDYTGILSKNLYPEHMEYYRDLGL